MNKKRVLEWGALIGFATGMVGLGTALVNSNDARRKADEQAKADRQMYERNAELQRRAIEEQQRELAAQAHLRSCELHNRSIAATNDDFDNLYHEHGQLMNFMRSCLRNGAGKQQQYCTMAVCAMGVVLAKSNCFEVASIASSLNEKATLENNLARADGCDVPASAATNFFSTEKIQAQQDTITP